MHLLFLLRFFVKKKLNWGQRRSKWTVSIGMRKTAKLSWNFHTLKRESYINTIIFGAILLLPLASLTIVVGQAIGMLLSDR
jgi:hypothetical protein